MMWQGSILWQNCMDLGITQPFTSSTQGTLDIKQVNNLYLVSLTTPRIIVLKIKHCLRAFLIAAKYKLVSWPKSIYSLLLSSWYETFLQQN